MIRRGQWAMGHRLLIPSPRPSPVKGEGVLRKRVVWAAPLECEALAFLCFSSPPVGEDLGEGYSVTEFSKFLFVGGIKGSLQANDQVFRIQKSGFRRKVKRIDDEVSVLTTGASDYP